MIKRRGGHLKRAADYEGIGCISVQIRASEAEQPLLNALRDNSHGLFPRLQDKTTPPLPRINTVSGRRNEHVVATDPPLAAPRSPPPTKHRTRHKPVNR